MRKSHGLRGSWRRGKRCSITPKSTVCRSSTLKESYGNDMLGWNESWKADNHVSSPMKAIFLGHFVRQFRLGYVTITHLLACTFHLSYNGVFHYRRPSEIRAHINKRRQRPSRQSLDTLQRGRGRI